MIERSVKSFCAYLRLEKGCSAATIAKYQRELQRLGRFLQQDGFCSLDQVSHIELRAYLYQRAGDLSRHTFSTALATLKSFFKFTTQEGMTPLNPTSKLSFPRKSRLDQLPQYIEQSSQLHLTQTLLSLKRNFTNDRNRAIMFAFLYSGMRTSELCTLRRDDISLQTQTMIITRKGGKQQVLPVAHTLLNILETYWMPWYNKVPSEYFFCTKQGKPMTPRTIWHLVSLYLGDLEGYNRQKQGAHVLRHTFATNLVHRQANLIEIQNLLGHADVRMTQIYTHVSPDSLRNTVNLLNSALEVDLCGD